MWKLTPPEINDLMKGLEASNKLQKKMSNKGKNNSANKRQEGQLSKSDLKAVEKVRNKQTNG